jgi:hypothetical protein
VISASAVERNGTMKTTAILLVTLLGVVSTGCSGWEARRAALDAPTADVGGTWTGNTTGEDKPYPITLTLDQTGTDVTGVMWIGGLPNLSGRVRGTVRGEVLSLSLTTAAQSGGELWVQQDNMMTSNAFGLHFTLRRSK